MANSKALEALKRLKELQVKCLPDYDADEKTLHFKWYLDTPDAIELARMIIDLDEQTTDALAELAEIKRRAESERYIYKMALDFISTHQNTGEKTISIKSENEQKLEIIDYILKGEKV